MIDESTGELLPIYQMAGAAHKAVAALEKIAAELRDLRINSAIIATALQGGVDNGEATVASSLTSIAISAQATAQMTEELWMATSTIAGNAKAIADAVCDTDEDMSVSIQRALSTIVFEMQHPDENSPTERITASLEKMAAKA